MSRAAVFLFSLGVGSWLLGSAVSGCSSSNDAVTGATVSAEAGAPGQGGLSAVTDGNDAGPNANANANVAPTPLIASVTPSFAAVGALGPTLVVKGTSFSSTSVIRTDSTELATTYFSDSELHAALPNDALSVATTLHISVKTPAPGGGVSQVLPFEVRNPMPALTTLTPSSALAGASDTAITISGSSFAPMAAVFFDATSLTVNNESTDTITTTIPASLLTVSGSHNITVVNATPGGGTSNAISFTVTNPNVVITSVTPSLATVGDGAKPIAIVGTGFVSATTIAFNGTIIPSTFTDSSHIAATLGAASFANPGNFPVVATNPAPGGGVSAPATFQVQNPVPQVANLSPNTVFYDAGNTTITVNGSSFEPTSSIVLGTTSLATTFVSSTQLTAVVPAASFTALTTLSITVSTPAPGGGTSNAVSLFVTCDSTGVDVPLGSVGNITTRSTFYSGPDVNHLASGTCPAALSGFIEPIDVFVVQNTTTSPVVLSSWAVCSVSGSVQSDGFLALYSGGTPPANDTARLACATGTVVSEGALGAAGDYESPDSNGSEWCPGLTKANGSGLTLGACAKAVVTLQPYSVASGSDYVPPTQIRFEPEAP